jgi:long-chain fatty acid transport protein
VKKCIWVAALAACVVAGEARAGGFNVYEMGARATALGGAFTATADDGSALFYNPAGLAWLDEGWHTSVNVSFILPKSKYERSPGVTGYPGADTAETEDAVFTPGGIYASYHPSQEWAFGFGVFTPFGLGVEWADPDDFAGRPLATNSQIQGIYMSPMVTWRPAPSFAVSAGGHAVVTHLTLERIVTGGTDLSQNLADFELSGWSGVSFGPAFGVMVRPNEKFSLGLNFKGGVTNSFEDQDADLDFRSDDLGPDRALKVSGDLDYPSILSAGIRFMATEKLALMFDFVWFDWSVFDVVELNFDDSSFDTVLEENYDDGEQWRFGVEYMWSDATRLLGGFVYDQTPQPVESISALLPDADRRDYSLGISHRGWGGEWTLAYMLVDFLERDTLINGVGQNPNGFDGAFRSIAHIPTVGFSRNF